MVDLVYNDNGFKVFYDNVDKTVTIFKDKESVKIFNEHAEILINKLHIYKPNHFLLSLKHTFDEHLEKNRRVIEAREFVLAYTCQEYAKKIRQLENDLSTFKKQKESQ